jgi:hypothetical protein
MKRAGIERDEKREEMRPDFKGRMKHAPNWENMEPNDGPITDRFHIDPDQIPEGMAAQWVTDSVYGQPQTYHRSGFEKNGWTPVNQEDFEGRFDGQFMPKGQSGEIKIEGSTLMMRPQELSDQAKLRDAKAAKTKVKGREEYLTGASALPSNRITKSYEKLDIPND